MQRIVRMSVSVFIVFLCVSFDSYAVINKYLFDPDSSSNVFTYYSLLSEQAWIAVEDSNEHRLYEGYMRLLSDKLNFNNQENCDKHMGFLLLACLAKCQAHALLNNKEVEDYEVLRSRGEELIRYWYLYNHASDNDVSKIQELLNFIDKEQGVFFNITY